MIVCRRTRTFSRPATPEAAGSVPASCWSPGTAAGDAGGVGQRRPSAARPEPERTPHAPWNPSLPSVTRATHAPGIPTGSPRIHTRAASPGTPHIPMAPQPYHGARSSQYRGCTSVDGAQPRHPRPRRGPRVRRQRAPGERPQPRRVACPAAAGRAAPRRPARSPSPCGAAAPRPRCGPGRPRSRRRGPPTRYGAVRRPAARMVASTVQNARGREATGPPCTTSRPPARQRRARPARRTPASRASCSA